MALPVRHHDTGESRPQHWQPFREFEELHKQMGQLLESVWARSVGSSGGTAGSPLVDVEETEEAWIVEAELPGVHRKDVTVELRDSELAISGEIKERERKGASAGARAVRADSTTASRCPAKRTPSRSRPSCTT